MQDGKVENAGSNFIIRGIKAASVNTEEEKSERTERFIAVHLQTVAQLLLCTKYWHPPYRSSSGSGSDGI